MRILPAVLISAFVVVACNNNPADEKGLDKDTMEAITGYGAGHEPGDEGLKSPSYPKPAVTNEEQDTSRGIHGVNIDTTK